MTVIDTHCHVFDALRFPLPDGPGYKPTPAEMGAADELLAAHDASGVTHAVIVQPSGYGYDNACTLDAVARAPERLRAICVVPPDVSAATLSELATRGAAGIRLNLVNRPDDLPEGPDGEGFLARIAEAGMLVQIHAPLAAWPMLLSRCAAAGVDVIADHLGRPDLSAPFDAEAWRTLLDAARDELAWIKLSGGYRMAQAAPGGPGARDLTRAILDHAGADRCIWGSDWPFIGVRKRPTIARELADLENAVEEAATMRRILHDVPARLFGFGGAM